jgi:hypothetical protein
MKVGDKPLTMPPPEKTEEVWQPENDFRTGFLMVFQLPKAAERDRKETVRFPDEPSSRPGYSSPRSVSMIVRRDV